MWILLNLVLSKSGVVRRRRPRPFPSLDVDNDDTIKRKEKMMTPSDGEKDEVIKTDYVDERAKGGNRGNNGTTTMTTTTTLSLDIIRTMTPEDSRPRWISKTMGAASRPWWWIPPSDADASRQSIPRFAC